MAKAEASGPNFAELLRARAEQLGMDAHIAVEPWDTLGGYTVDVEMGGQPDAGWLYEVNDGVDGVRVLDPHGEDMSINQGVA